MTKYNISSFNPKIFGLLLLIIAPTTFGFGFWLNSLYKTNSDLTTAYNTGYDLGFDNGVLTGYDYGLGNASLSSIDHSRLIISALHPLSIKWISNSTEGLENQIINSSYNVNYSIKITLDSGFYYDHIIEFFENLSSWYYNATGESNLENYPNIQTADLNVNNQSITQTINLNMNPNTFNFDNFSIDIFGSLNSLRITSIEYIITNGTVESGGSGDVVANHFNSIWSNMVYYSTDHFYFAQLKTSSDQLRIASLDDSFSYLSPSMDSAFGDLMIGIMTNDIAQNETFGNYIHSTFIPAFQTMISPMFLHFQNNTDYNLQLGNMIFNQDTGYQTLELTENSVGMLLQNDWTYTIL